jgi:hypothetical protein
MLWDESVWPFECMSMQSIRQEIRSWNLNEIMLNYFRNDCTYISLTSPSVVETSRCITLTWTVCFRDLGFDFEFTKRFEIHPDGRVIDLGTCTTTVVESPEQLRDAIWDHFRAYADEAVGELIATM